MEKKVSLTISADLLKKVTDFKIPSGPTLHSAVRSLEEMTVGIMRRDVADEDAELMLISFEQKIGHIQDAGDPQLSAIPERPWVRERIAMLQRQQRRFGQRTRDESGSLTERGQLPSVGLLTQKESGIVDRDRAW